MDVLVRNEGTGFWEWLRQQKIEYSKDDFPWLTPDDPPKIIPLLDFDKYMGLSSRGEAISYLYRGLGRTLNYIGPVLDADVAYGFNDHTDRHTLWVAQVGLELLLRAGVGRGGKSRVNLADELLMILVGMTHDIGNLAGRKGHAVSSAEILSQLFTNRVGREEEWGAAMQAVKYHDEATLASDGFDLARGGPLLWALIVADKLHVGRDRVGDKSIATGQNGSIEEDAHVLLNCLVTRSTWYLSEGAFVWHLDFSVDQLTERFESFTHNKDRVWVPHEFQVNFRKQGKAYRETFAVEFLRVYGERVKLAREAVLLLFKNVDTFKIILSDDDAKNKVGRAVVEIGEWGR